MPSIKPQIAPMPKQKVTADSLGLRRIGDSVEHEDNAVLAGKIKILSHLVKVENV